MLPLGRASGRVQALDGFRVGETVKENNGMAGHCDAREPLPHLFLPDLGRALSGPVGGQIVTGIDAIAGGAEELGPVGRLDDTGRKAKMRQ